MKARLNQLKSVLSVVDPSRSDRTKKPFEQTKPLCFRAKLAGEICHPRDLDAARVPQALFHKAWRPGK
jgi:hypothetical protein